MNSIQMNNVGRHFKGIMAIMMSLPDSIMKALNPQFGQFLGWKDTLAKQVQKVLDEHAKNQTEG